MKHAQRWFALAAFALLPFSAAYGRLRLDPAKAMTQYVIASWRDTSGLPVDSVGDVVQTGDGYLWLATEAGLVRFDGVRFTVFNRDNTPALRSSEIYTLFVSSDGTLWVGTRGGGAVRYDGSQFHRLPIRYRFISDFAESYDGAIWIAAPGGMARLRGGQWKSFEKEQGYPEGGMSPLAADGNGAYVGTPNGVVRIDDQGARSWTSAEGLTGGAVTALLWTDEGLLAGNETGAVDRLVGDRFQNVFRSPDGHPISSIHQGAGDSLWMSTTGGGLLRYADGEVARLTEKEGLTSDSLNPLLEDDEGNLWAGTTGGGLLRLKEGRVATVATKEPLNGEWILAMAEGRDGSVWFTTNGGGLNRLQGQTVTRMTTAQGLHSNSIQAIVEDREGGIWIGTELGLQRIVSGRVVRSIGEKEGLAGGRVLALTVTRDGTLWASTREGLYNIKGAGVRRLTEKDGLAKGTVVAIREAPDGSLWFAKPRAVEHFVDGKLTCFTRDDGLNTTTITAITLDEKDGSVWVATMGDGLFRISNGNVRTYRAANGLMGDTTYNVVQDRNGNLWVPTNHGLMKLKRASLDRFDAGIIQRIPTQTFHKADGLKSNDFSGGFDRPGFRAVDGRLWFPTTRGLVVVDPERVNQDSLPPRLIIERVVANGINHGMPAARIDLPRENRQIEIAYASPAFDSPETITFRYRLAGFDDHWRDAGTRRTAYFTNVPPGQYQFLVQATTADGMTGTTSTTIEIQPQFLETWNVRAAAVLAVLLVILLLHRRRVDSLRRHQRELKHSEEHFRSLIENAADMILVVDRDGTIGYASPSVERVLGVEPRDMEGLPFLSVVAGGDQGEAFLSGVGQHGNHSATLPFNDAAGARRDVECIAARFEGDGRIVLNCRDITDRRRLESQLEQSNRLASLGRLAATVAHEFNNVLMGIQPFVDLIRRTSKDRAAINATTPMTQVIQRGKRISDEILRYTRPPEPALRPVEVRSWLQDLETEMRSQVGPNVRTAILAHSRLFIEADVAQLSQALINLAINARDAGASSIRIEARAVEGNGVFAFGIVRDPERFVQISFIDDGSGIPEAIRAKVFEPLFTTKTSKGTGLGLAVTQQVVVRHGGEIFVDSKVGDGTTFHLFLPRAKGEVRDLHEVDKTPATAAVGARVLLVEDDSAVSSGILALLECEGMEVELAATGCEALERIPRFNPDVVLLDIGLPDINGVEVYRRIRQQWPDLRVIFSTGHGDSALLENTLPQPHPPFLQKPYDFEALMAVLADVIDRQSIA